MQEEDGNAFAGMLWALAFTLAVVVPAVAVWLIGAWA